MPDNVVKFDLKTKQLVDNLTLAIRQAEGQLRLLCEVYLNARGKDSIKNNFQLLPDNSGLMKVEDKKVEPDG